MLYSADIVVVFLRLHAPPPPVSSSLLYRPTEWRSKPSKCIECSLYCPKWRFNINLKHSDGTESACLTLRCAAAQTAKAFKLADGKSLLKSHTAIIADVYINWMPTILTHSKYRPPASQITTPLPVVLLSRIQGIGWSKPQILGIVLTRNFPKYIIPLRWASKQYFQWDLAIQILLKWGSTIIMASSYFCCRSFKRIE